MTTALDPTLKDIIDRSTSVVIFTGAGVSAESGVPTFRDAQTGLWARYNAEELATPGAFRRQPDLVWQWYQWRRELIRAAQPNAAHTAIAEWEQRRSELKLITQNVDDLHRRAGSCNILQLHGDIFGNRCQQHGAVKGDFLGLTQAPHCERCHTPIRPTVVWFGESLEAETLDAATKACRNCDLLVSIGTSALVSPACELPLIARENGAVTVEVNLTTTMLTDLVDYSLPGKAATWLPTLLSAVSIC